VLSLAADATGVTAVGVTQAGAHSAEVPVDAFIVRYDRSGNLLWSEIFGLAEASEIAWGVAADEDALTVTGHTYGALDG
jgi:hypothetical protein